MKVWLKVAFFSHFFIFWKMECGEGGDFRQDDKKLLAFKTKSEKNHDQNRKGKKGVFGGGVAFRYRCREICFEKSRLFSPEKMYRKINAGHICHFFVLSCCVSRPQAKGEK